MGFINNTSYILNAVLTKKGKQYLSKSDSRFNIVKFALADDEIDYGLWNHAHPNGSDYYGAVLESMPMVEPCVDPEVVMKYKLFTAPAGTKSLAYISNITPQVLTGDNSLKSTYTADNRWTFNDHLFNPKTVGFEGHFSQEKYSFLVLNNNICDVRPGTGTWEDLQKSGVVTEELTGRSSKKVISRTATIRTQPLTVNRQTSIIITGQMSGAIYVVPIEVKYENLALTL